jgi:hypothetical protein
MAGAEFPHGETSTSGVCTKEVQTGGGHLKRMGNEETKESKEERGQEAAAARLPVRGEIDGMPRETQVWAIGGVTEF